MDKRMIGILAGLVSAVSLAVQVVPEWLLERWMNSGPEHPLLLMLGTVGQTFTTYSLLFRILGPLVTVGFAVALGYVVGRRVDMVARYRRFVGAVTVGSILGVVIGWPVTVALVIGSIPISPDAQSIVLHLLSYLPWIASVSLVVTVGTFAGAALAHFSTTGETPPNPTTADTATKSSATPDATPDHEDQHSQPTQ